MAWKVTGSDQYRVWNTDSSGNQISQTDILSGTSVALESLETSFHQDLNHNGVVGVFSHLASAAALNSGSNNPPTIDVSSLANQNTFHILADNSSVSALLASDTFRFYDMPVNDIHNVSISVNPTALSTPIAGAHDTTGINGVAAWNYQVNEASIHSLVASATDSFAASLTDHHEGISTTTISVLHLLHDFHVV